jgi:hypothetical protein
LKKRTKKLLLFEVGAAAAPTAIGKSFCFFFQKEVLSSFLIAVSQGTPT